MPVARRTTSTPVDLRKFATRDTFGFKEKPEAFVRPDLSADLLHAICGKVGLKPDLQPE
jgi:hypothetical protein